LELKKTDLFNELGANYTLKFIDLLLIVLMLLENLKSKKIQNVCVEIWLHPLHPVPPNPQRGNKWWSVGRKKSGNLRLPLLIFLSLYFGLSVGLIYFFVGEFFYCVDWTSFSH
jgi:hypothetical protein